MAKQEIALADKATLDAVNTKVTNNGNVLTNGTYGLSAIRNLLTNGTYGLAALQKDSTRTYGLFNGFGSIQYAQGYKAGGGMVSVINKNGSGRLLGVGISGMGVTVQSSSFIEFIIDGANIGSQVLLNSTSSFTLSNAIDLIKTRPDLFYFKNSLVVNAGNTNSSASTSMNFGARIAYQLTA